MASVPTCSEDETLFGMTWADIFRLRDTRAKVYERRFGYRVPLHELYSAGNLAITEALTRYVPPAEKPSLRSYLWSTLALAYRDCKRRELKECFSQPGPHKGSRKLVFHPVVHVPIENHPIPTYVHFAEAYDARRCLAQLRIFATEQEQHMLLASLQGETDRAIGAAHGKSLSTVFKQNQRTLRRLQRWALRGLPLPEEGTRRTVKLTPALVATIRRLFSEAIPKARIARRLGCGRDAIYQALKQRDTVCPG